CTNNGKLLHTGITGHRPCAATTRPPRQTRRKGGIVELQITATRLLELAHNPTHHRWWAPLINDLARQHTAHNQTVESATPTGAALRRTPTRNAAPTDADADKRRAGAALRRYVQIRGRVCSWPGCRTPATKTDQDHAIDHAAGGTTLHDNLHLACRHDHRAKHHGGWHVTMPEPNTILWTSPLGHPYPSPIPPIITPLPPPQPRTQPEPPPEHTPDHDQPTLTSENLNPPEGEKTETEKGDAYNVGPLLDEELARPPF
ncbi:HNH endonuclease signature motif containing protein, partial [Planotetraspora thailandica]|uniref:HNH endonuclease signature motif containing protein n=1 Tax=Planotetraspora thailandica TaxID=487172 RepID=UPI0035E64842